MKTGFNEAFVIDTETKDKLVLKDANSNKIIKPLLRGRDIKKYHHNFADLWLICTFPALDIDIDAFPAIKEHLLSFGYDRLKQVGEKGSRKKSNNKWFETQDSISYWDDFSKQKIVWAELSRSGNAFTYDDTQSLVLNTCYMLTINRSTTNFDLKYLLSILNSKPILFYMNLISSKLDETGWRWLKQFVEILPIPFVNNETEESIISIVNQMIDNKKDTLLYMNLEKEISQIIYRIFRLSVDEISCIENN